MTLANTAQPLFYQDAIIMVKRHHVGDRTQRNEVQPLREIGDSYVPAFEPAARFKPGTQGHQHVKHHADTGERFAGKNIPRLIRIDNGIGSRQFLTRQVVIGDQHIDAKLARGSNAIDTGNTIINGNQQVRLLARSDVMAPRSVQT